MTKKPKLTDDQLAELEQHLGELTLDLQRTRADFENYRKRVEVEKQAAQTLGETKAIMKLLPVIDTLDRAVASVPAELKDNSWAKGITAVSKQLDKQLAALHVAKIQTTPGTKFDPELHQAVQFDEESEGEHEVIAEEMQAGYTLNGAVIRHAMVKVARA